MRPKPAPGRQPPHGGQSVLGPGPDGQKGCPLRRRPGNPHPARPRPSTRRTWPCEPGHGPLTARRGAPGAPRILTHCNAGALPPGLRHRPGVIARPRTGVKWIWFTPMRPAPAPGARLTAYELVTDHIPATLIADNMAASLMAKGRSTWWWWAATGWQPTEISPTRSAPTPWR